MDHHGANLKKIRTAKGMSLRQLADISGVSVSQISKIETGKGDTTVNNVIRLAQALDVPASRLIDGDPHHVAKPVRAGEGFVLRRQVADDPRISEIYLDMTPGANMQPELLHLPPGASSGKPLTHGGEEFCYVLSGTARFFLGDAEYLISEGDSIYFDNRIPHRWENENGEEWCRLLICCSPPVLR